MDVKFHFQKKTTLQNRKKIKSYLGYIANKEKVSINKVEIIFCSDDYLLGINRQNLNHDYYTDIVTFNLAIKGMHIQGEIYISIDRVRENATIFKSTLRKELLRVIFHGVLHLCGYLDKTKIQKNLMTQKEDFYLDKYVSRET